MAFFLHEALQKLTRTHKTNLKYNIPLGVFFLNCLWLHIMLLDNVFSNYSSKNIFTYTSFSVFVI